MKIRHQAGFTLIEIMVVIAITSVLSTFVLASLSRARARATDANRLSGIQQMREALELYYLDKGHYPSTFSPGQGVYPDWQFPKLFEPDDKLGLCWASEDPVTHKMNPDLDMPDFIPKYMRTLPKDATLNCDGITHGWFYASDGKDYKLITHISNPEEVNTRYHPTTDPVWDDGPDPCKVDGTSGYHQGYWTPGANCWSI